MHNHEIGHSRYVPDFTCHFRKHDPFVRIFRDAPVTLSFSITWLYSTELSGRFLDAVLGPRPVELLPNQLGD